MTLTDRDKKLVMLLVPVVLVLAYWFLLLSPTREEAATLGTQLSQAETERDEAQALASEAQRTKGSYARDYETVVRLGKAIPSEVDLPSLIVQLDQAASDTDIRFVKIATGERSEAPAAPTPPDAGEGEPPASEAGGEPAATGSGAAVEGADEGAAAAEGAPPAAAPTAGAPATAAGAPGLESVPLSFSFQGSFFDLADFFHEMKRFVRIAGDGVRVNGRLMTIDGFTFSSETFPTISAEVEASVYLSPQDEGTAAGATPAGPGTAPAAGAPAPAAPEAPPVAAPPVATAIAGGAR